MKRLYFLTLALSIAAGTFAQLPNGLYEGREGNGKPYYHHNLLLVDNDSLFLYKTPMIKENGKIYNSASDGGFHYFCGTSTRTDSGAIIHLIEYNCDYCFHLFRTDSSTGFMYPIPRTHTFRLTPTSTGFSINKVAYHKSNSSLDNFPSRAEFYPDPDSNWIYREEPNGQYQLISTGMKNFLQTNLLVLDHDTLRICLDRTSFTGKSLDSVIETLDPHMIRVDTTNITLCFYTISQLKQLTSTGSRPVRFIQIKEIIDYWKAARIKMTYVISLPKSIHHFSEHQYNVLFEYKKVGGKYVFPGPPPEAGWTLIEQK